MRLVWGLRSPVRSAWSADLESRTSPSTCTATYLGWTWSVLRAVFVLKAGPSWVKVKQYEWKPPKGFTVRVLFNQTNRQTNKPLAKLSDVGVLPPTQGGGLSKDFRGS